MFQSQNRETKIALEKLLCPPRSLWRRAWQDRVSQHNTKPARPRQIFWSQIGLVLRPTVSDHITDTYAEDLLCSGSILKDFLDSITLPSRPLHSPPLLEVGPLNPARGSGGSAVGSPSGVCGGAPAEFWILVHFSLKIWHLVATVLMIFLRINWPNAILDSTFFVLDSTFWLDSTLKIDPGCVSKSKTK